MDINHFVTTFFQTYNSIYSNTNSDLICVKEFLKITTKNYKIALDNYVRELIMKNINTINSTQHNQITQNLIENELDPDNGDRFSLNKIKDIVNSDDFYGLYDILEVLFPNKEYENDDTYKKLLKYKNAKLSVNPIQYHNNKLFLQTHNKTYYFYFSFGTLKNIELVDWKESLKVYVREIKNILTDEDVKHIVLAGHSVGAITCQHLAIELILNGIDISKIFIIGSGCLVDNVLNDTDYQQFTKNYENKYHFVLSGFLDNNKIYYDSVTPINKINSHLLVCHDQHFADFAKKFIGDAKDFLNYTCINVTYNTTDYNEIISTDSFVPLLNIVLHDFDTYRKLFFT